MGRKRTQGGNINTDTNNVYCKHISICLWHEKRWLFVWFIEKFQKIDEGGGGGLLKNYKEITCDAVI